MWFFVVSCQIFMTSRRKSNLIPDWTYFHCCPGTTLVVPCGTDGTCASPWLLPGGFIAPFVNRRPPVRDLWRADLLKWTHSLHPSDDQGGSGCFSAHPTHCVDHAHAFVTLICPRRFFKKLLSLSDHGRGLSLVGHSSQIHLVFGFLLSRKSS